MWGSAVTEIGVLIVGTTTELTVRTQQRLVDEMRSGEGELWGGCLTVAESAAAYCVERVEGVGGGSEQRSIWVTLRRNLKSEMGEAETNKSGKRWTASSNVRTVPSKVGLPLAQKNGLPLVITRTARSTTQSASSASMSDLGRRRQRMARSLSTCPVQISPATSTHSPGAAVMESIIWENKH
ncbi:hypothetical protein BLNAU_18144 [Blattamonas nauphoetae]|uniref:Uncharacterized protein n=1 Tax=Blattamonas nauphoetae TaxID=2049346 RepID=A0ABQ9X5F3_9EUKA|nr:hypothetical protein BLNAU_18144 [Blattamonas nauphoetae]